MKDSLTCLEKMKRRKKRHELREWKEIEEKLLEKQLRKERDLQDYLKTKGELE